MLSTYIRWVTDHAIGVVAAFVLVTIAFVSQLGTLKVEINPDSQLPQGHRYIEALNRLHSVFGEKNLVFIGLFPTKGDIYDPAFLRKLSRITERIGELPGLVRRTYSSLALPRAVDIRGSADGMSVTPLLDPLPETAEEARALRERVERNPQFLDVLAARNGEAAAIIADFDFVPPLSGYPEVHAAVEDVLADEQDGTFRAHLSGPAIYMAWLAHYSTRMIYFFPLALLVIGLIHYEAFRTLQAIILPLATALLAMVWSLGILGVLGVPLDPFNVTTPILILAVAAGHAVQMLKRFYEEDPQRLGPREAVVRSIVRVGPVMITAGLIASLSFLSLLTFRTASIRNFGLFTAIGILSALVVEMTFIPAVRSLLPTPSRREQTRERSRHFFDPLTESIAPYLLSGGWRVVLFVAAVAMLLGGVAASRVTVDSSFRKQFFASATIRVDDAALNTAFGGTSTLVLLIDGGRPGAVDEPALLAAVDRLQGWLDEQPDVGKTLSFVDFVKRMHAAMNGEVPESSLPDTPDLVAQYLLLYSFSGSVEDFDSLVDPTHRLCALRVFLRQDSTRSATRLIDALEPLARELLPPGYSLQITGSLASSHALNETMVQGKIRNILQIGAIILIVASLVLRSVVGGLLVATPLVFAVVLTFGLMGLLQISLDIGTATISAMAVGIGADYAVYFLFRLREELGTGAPLPEALQRTLGTAGKAVLFVSSAIASGYLTLCFSGFGYHIHLGGLVAFAMAVSSLATLTVLPALILVMNPRFLIAVRSEPDSPSRLDRAASG